MKRPVNELNYLFWMETTDTSEEVNEVLSYMKSRNINLFNNIYIPLIEKQKDYYKARKIFNEFVINSGEKDIKSWEKTHCEKQVKEIYGAMYIKAEKKEEIEEIKSLLMDLNMSTNINDYNYLKVKSNIRRINLMKNDYSTKDEEEYWKAEIKYFYDGSKKTYRNKLNNNPAKI